MGVVIEICIKHPRLDLELTPLIYERCSVECCRVVVHLVKGHMTKLFRDFISDLIFVYKTSFVVIGPLHVLVWTSFFKV